MGGYLSEVHFLNNGSRKWWYKMEYEFNSGPAG